jgi:hypothetical protein
MATAARFYIYDLETRKELKDHPMNGRPLYGTGPMVRNANGEYVKGTVAEIEIKYNEFLRRDDFDRDVAIKCWWPYTSGTEIEWRRLVRSDAYKDSTKVTAFAK